MEVTFLKKLLFVMNPQAGQKKANKSLAEILAVFNQAGYEVTTYMTEYSGHAVKIVQNRAQEHDLVVCAGGDGTLNETVTGLLRSGVEIPVGYIPCGSTNDFASSLKLSGNVVQAARDIVEGEPVPYDVGKFCDRYFVYVASFGAFTKASYSTPQNVKNALGHLAYVLDSIQEIPQIRTTHGRFELDGEIVEDDFLFGAISNSTSVGGILSLSPDQVDMGDGEFELLLVRMPRSLAELSACIQALRSQKYDCSVITFRNVSRLTVSNNPVVTWTLDGEREDGSESMEVVNLHHAVRIMQRMQE